MPQVFDMNEMLRQLQEPEKVYAADPLAQMMELQSRWRAHSEPSDLQPGDLCMEKPGFISSNELLDGRVVYLVWGPIDQENQMHAMTIADWGAHFGVEPYWDIFVGFVAPKTGKFYTRPHCSSWLRPLTAAEMRGLD